jgi:predicted nucleic acid-binding protein
VLQTGARVVVPAIADYELRRELLRAGLANAVDRLNRLSHNLGRLPLTDETLEQAAAFWARARNQGHVTAPAEALDGDCILAAHAITAPQLLDFSREDRVKGINVVVATTNPNHLKRYVNAELWSKLSVGTS